MTEHTLVWSDPTPDGRGTIEARDGTHQWRIETTPGDRTRIFYASRQPDGTIVASTTACAHAESVEEAKMIVGILASGTDALPDWREQLVQAGFVRTHPDSKPGGTRERLWMDDRKSGLYEICVSDRWTIVPGDKRTGIDTSYEGSSSGLWHGVCYVDGGPNEIRTISGQPCRGGLPDGIDALRAGVAASIAIRDARVARGGRFATPIGGFTKARKRP